MKSFKRLAVMFAVVIALSGCAAIQTAVNDVGGFLTGTAVPDICAAAKFYETYVQGVVQAVTVFPAVAAVVGPYVALANTAIAALNADCQSGAMLATIETDLANVDNAITQINSAVGNAQASGLMK